jgi:ABC-type multidrug transport system ATPase subunit
MFDENKVIEVTGLTKNFKNITAVNSLNLNVYKGDVFGFLGPNGAGKSTTIRMLLTLINPTAGEIRIFGKPLKSCRAEILSRTGAIVEKPDFYLYLTAYKNLEILGSLAGAETSRKRIMELLALVGLSERYNSKVKTFSYGMKQRLGIAQALIHDPDLIILDEPTTGLDPQGVKEIRDLIIHLSHDRGKTIFISSHILSEIELVANRMIIINKGETKVEGTVNDLLCSGNLKVRFSLSPAASAESVIRNSQWKETLTSNTNNDFEFNLQQKDIHNLNEYLVSNKIAVSSIVAARSLEDYFLSITNSN